MEQNPQENTVSLKCKNPTHQCPSITAVEIKQPNKAVRLYRCVKCNYTRPITVGGQLDLNQL